MSDSSETELCQLTDKPKKKRKFVRQNEVVKKLRVASHAIGEDCKCSRRHCFDEVPHDARMWIIKNFNSIPSHNQQTDYLAGLITVKPIKQRRSRKPPSERAFLNEHAYTYKVRYLLDDHMIEKEVCYKAFISMHGISNTRVANIKKSLCRTGKPNQDMRGRHNHHKHHLTDEVKDTVMKHISAFKGRKAHYSTHDSKRTYLPEDLNVKKMHSMYKEENPAVPVSYDTYRHIFLNKFNISFGYPRTDTCSICDEINSKITNLEKIISGTPEVVEIQAKLKILNIERNLHHKKAEKFYELKRTNRFKAKRVKSYEAYAFDLQKNLPLPNVTTNNAYYCRQLSFYSFNIHQLSTRSSYFYVYDETRGRKGLDDVVSMLNNFLMHFVPADVKKVFFFCDSCSGQNKNYTMFRYLYYLVHILHRFEYVSVIFPIRGHSYLECDKNMGLIQQKTPCNTPDDWVSVFERARKKPEPFKVVDCYINMFKNCSKKLNTYFVKKCPFPSRPVRQLTITIHAPRQILVKADNYNSTYDSYLCVPRNARPLVEPESIEPLYKTLLPISKEKYKDLQVLKKICSSPESQNFYDNLKTK